MDETETEASQKGGKLTVKVAEGSGASERSKETKRKLAVTDRIPTILLQLQQAKNLMPYIELMRLVGEDPLTDPKTAEAVTGMGSLQSILAERPIPLLFEAVSASDFRFFASLSRQHLRCDLSDLQGEAVVFG